MSLSFEAGYLVIQLKDSYLMVPGSVAGVVILIFVAAPLVMWAVHNRANKL